MYKAVNDLAVLRRVVSCCVRHPSGYVRIEIALSDALVTDEVLEMAKGVCGLYGAFVSSVAKNHFGQNCLVLSRLAHL